MNRPEIRFIALAVGIVLWLSAPAQAQNPPGFGHCHVRPANSSFGMPDNARSCTPGAFRKLPRFPRPGHPNEPSVCESKDRPTLTASVRRTVLNNYGVPNWTGRNGEIDHRVPFFLGGTTTVANLWPEPGPIPNPKDALEFRVFRMVCFKDPFFMRVRMARLVFLGFWTFSFDQLVLGSGPVPVE